MTTITAPAAEVARIVRAVEKSAAKDPSRPALAGISVTLEAGKLTTAAADGFRLSTAYTTLAEADDAAPAILDRAALLAFVKTIKPKYHPNVTIEPSANAWTFSANGTRASVPTIDATHPDFRQIVGSGEEPVLFCVNPSYFANVLASHGADVIRVSRANDSLSSPLFFTADDGTRHVVMPMVIQDAERAPVAKPEPKSEPAPEPEVEQDIIDAQRAAYDAQTAAYAAVGKVNVHPWDIMPSAGAYVPVTSPAISCPDCGDTVIDSDRYCGSCGLVLRVPSASADLSAYSEPNQRRILDQCPHATDVRGFRAWQEIGRTVRRGEKGIKIHAPITRNVDGSSKVVAIKPAYVFDISQTDALPQEAAA
jgi:hypothetical protein